jgi:hypothetical protein
LIAPFANQRSNVSDATFDYQFARNAMIGASGSYSFLQYTDHFANTGLNDGNTTGAMGFYNRRIARSEYVGAEYQFSKFVTHPIETNAITHSVFGFYTHYFTSSFSFSILAGPEHYSLWQPAVAKAEAWTPAGQGNLEWQTARTNLSATYSHMVSGASGLAGAFHSDTGTLDGRAMLSRTWSVGLNGQYSLLKSIEASQYAGGHSLSATVDVQHRITEGLGVAAGYGHIHESYAAVAAASFAPDSNRIYVSVNYEFHRPLGR